MERKKILLVAMADSVHVARWLDSVSELPIDVVLISSSPNRWVHPGILRHKQGTGGLTVSIPFLTKFLAIPFWVLDKTFIFSGRLRGLVIAHYVRRMNPSCIHIMESQNGGYAYLRARSFSLRVARLPVLLTLFGSDLYWFSRFPTHSLRLRELMSVVDLVATEGRRDRILARNMGFQGEFLTSMPASGGILESEFIPVAALEPLARKTIAVKGYSNSLGVGERALESLKLVLPAQLMSWQIVVFSAQGKSIRAAMDLRKMGYDVRIFRKHQLKHSEVLQILRRSRVFIGLSRSDGLPATFLEAMAQGAFPIQSTTSMADDWIKHAETGFLVDPDSRESIRTAIEHALKDDDLLQRAVTTNLAKVQAEASNERLSKILRAEFRRFVGV